MEKGTGFPVCNSSNGHEQSPIGVTDMRFLPDALSSSLLYVCEQ